MKTWRLAATAICAAISIGAQAQTVIKIGYTPAATSHYGVGSTVLCDEIEKGTQGRYKCQQFPAGSLGGEREMIEAVQLGTLDIVNTSTGPVGNFVPEVKIVDIPFLFRDYDHARRYLDSAAGQELLTKFPSKGLVALSWTENGFRHMTNSKRAIFKPADAAGLSLATRKLTDSRSHAHVTLANVKVGADAHLGGSDLLDRLLDRARIVTAAEMLGLAEHSFGVTLDYLKQRVQFGQILATFQALQHRMAELFTRIELMRTAVEAALAALDSKTDVPAMASLAKATANDTLHLVSREVIQLHGGIGMTDEYFIAFYMKRARVLENAWGSSTFHRDRYASLAGY